MTAVAGTVVLDANTGSTYNQLFLGVMAYDPAATIYTNPDGSITYHIDWGDGSPVETFSSLTATALTHNYTTTPHTISVSSPSATGTATMVWNGTVVNASNGYVATLDTQPPRVADDGNPNSVTLNLELQNRGVWPAQVTFYVNWGDGSPVESFTVATTSPDTTSGPVVHVYRNTRFPWCDIKIGCDAIPYVAGAIRRGTAGGNVQATVTPASGVAALDVTLTIQDIFITRTAPWLQNTAPILAAYNPNDTEFWLINWGDGICELASKGSGQTGPLTVPHRYDVAGTYSINVTSTGAQGVGTATVTATAPAQPTIPARSTARSSQVRFR